MGAGNCTYPGLDVILYASKNPPLADTLKQFHLAAVLFSLWKDTLPTGRKGGNFLPEGFAIAVYNLIEICPHKQSIRAGQIANYVYFDLPIENGALPFGCADIFPSRIEILMPFSSRRSENMKLIRSTDRADHVYVKVQCRCWERVDF